MSLAHSVDSSAQLKEELSFPSWQAWLVTLSAALFFFYEFIQMNMFNAISDMLMQAFSINATQLGTMSSYYFISNVIFLFPAGILLDRYSTKKIILISLAICVAGTALFANATSLGWATFFRFLTGIGSAFCFLSCIRLASRWFPTWRMAVVTGFIVTMAMLGGAIAQTPLTFLVNLYGWRQALMLDAFFGGVVFLLIFLLVQDYPKNSQQEYLQQQKAISEIGYWKSMRLAFLRLQNWLGGIYTCLMNLPLSLLGGLWGTLYLVDVHGLTKIHASTISSMLFIGTIIGSPISGWISDNLRLRRPPMMIGTLLSLALVLFIIYDHNLTYWELLAAFLMMGVITSTQIISYPLVAESSPKIITAMSVSVVSITCQAGQAFFQPLFGFLLDLHAHPVEHGIPVYTVADFHWAMLLLPLGFIVALFASFALRETHGQRIDLNQAEN